MPRTGKRVTIAKGIYRDGDDGPYEVRATVGGVTYPARMPKDSTLEELKAKRAALESTGRTETPRAERGTLRADATGYLKLIKHLASWDDREDHLRRWTDRLGDVYRHRITSGDVLAGRAAWLSLRKPLSPKTINHYVNTLRHLYRTLDGKRARTPVLNSRLQRLSEALDGRFQGWPPPHTRLGDLRGLARGSHSEWPGRVVSRASAHWSASRGAPFAPEPHKIETCITCTSFDAPTERCTQGTPSTLPAGSASTMMAAARGTRRVDGP